MSSLGTNDWNAFGIAWNDWCFVSRALPNRICVARGEGDADAGLWPPPPTEPLGISGGERFRFEMDGTRAGRVPSRGEEGSDGGLWTPGSATLDIFALTRTLMLGDEEAGMFSSGCEDDVKAERAGEARPLGSPCAQERSWDEDTLTLR